MIRTQNDVIRSEVFIKDEALVESITQDIMRDCQLNRPTAYAAAVIAWCKLRLPVLHGFEPSVPMPPEARPPRSS